LDDDIDKNSLIKKFYGALGMEGREKVRQEV
jgi:hypothetical protein